MNDLELAERRAVALRAAIARLKDLMRTAKRRGEMQVYASHLRQMYLLRQQLRQVQRVLDEAEPSA